MSQMRETVGGGRNRQSLRQIVRPLHTAGKEGEGRRQEEGGGERQARGEGRQEGGGGPPGRRSRAARDAGLRRVPPRVGRTRTPRVVVRSLSDLRG